MNKLQGELILDETSLQFRLNDFSESDLKMNLQLSEIDTVTYETVFGLDLKALKIITDKRGSNLFVLEGADEFRMSILNAKNLILE